MKYYIGAPWGAYGDQPPASERGARPSLAERSRRLAELKAIVPMRHAPQRPAAPVFDVERFSAAFRGEPSPASASWDAEAVAAAFHRAMHPLSETDTERRSRGSSDADGRWVPGCYR